MRHRHRHGKSPSLFHLVRPSTVGLVKDVALGAFIAREIIKK